MRLNARKELSKKFIGCIIALLIIVIYSNSSIVVAEKSNEKMNFIYGIKNVLLIVADEKLPYENGGKEVVICTFDNRHRKVKLTSILRDTCVKTPNGEHMTIGRLASEGTITYINDTLSNSFNLVVYDYAKVDLINLVNVVGSIQCLDIEIKEEELPYLKNERIYNKGNHRLTPNQVIAFTRIPEGNIGGRERSDRIRMVLAKCYQVVKVQNSQEYVSLIYQLIPCLKSNISCRDMVQIGLNTLTTTVKDLEELRLPFENHKKAELFNGVNYVNYNENYTKQAYHNYIYEDILPGN